MQNNVTQYINSHWDDCVRELQEDSGETIGLPYPYAIPAAGHFEELFYWDTYFLNKGLEISKKHLLAKCNADNMLYLIEKYGFMPNANKTYYIRDRISQPPFLSQMVRDVYEHFKDVVWLSGAYMILKKEYDFWMTERRSPNGLNFYSGKLTDEKITHLIAGMLAERIGYTPDISDDCAALHYMCCWESGWDMSPRWGVEGYNYNPVDLNSIMYMFEKNMEYFSLILSDGEEKEWHKRAEKRRELMNRYLTDENGIMLDYNYKTGKLSNVFSVASLYPLFVNMADENYAALMANRVERLECSYGLAACEKNDIYGTYQWSYPNGWACLQYIAVIGFKNYGFGEVASRLAAKYTSLVEKCFEETGNLWEKYNVAEGNVNICQEGSGEMPAMMGWSAGVYLALKDLK